MKKSILCIILAISMILPLAVTTSAYSVTARDFYMTTSDNPTLDFNITAYNSGSNYYIFLPNDVDSSNVVIRYNKSVSNVSGADWNSSVKTITCHGEGTITVNGKAFYIMQSSLPSLSISIDSGYSIDTIHQSKENKIRAHAEINGAGEYDLESLPIEYKTRGNSTFDFVKKPYQIKFDSKTDLFGMGKAKKWVLLANYIDGTMIRNKMMFDLGEEIGMPYIVQSVFIDLYVDGEYYGVYQLCEKVEIGSSRVDLTTDEGIIIEMDGANRDLSGEIYFKTKTTGKPIVYKEYNTDFEETEDPDTVAKVKEIRTFTENYINTLEAELYSEDPSWDVISSMIDVDSFINYFFITEFSCEYDATYASTFFYMDGPDDILHCGPLWDYDRIMGWNYGDERDTDSDFLKNIIDATEVTRVEWFKQLFRHPEFVQRANEIYEETIKPAFETEKVISMIDEYQETLMPSLRMNHVKFIVFHNVSYTVNELFDGTTDEYVEYTTDAIKNWIVERNTFLDSKYGINHPTLLYKAYYDGVAAAEYSGGSMTYDLGDMNSFSIRLEDSIFDGGIEYSASARSASFNWCADGAPLTASTVHNTFNGIKVRLTGNIANYFSVEYRVYRNGSWSAWAMDGKNAGATAGASYVKRIQIRLVEKKDVEYGAINFVNNAGGAPEAIKTIPGNAYSIADIP
ncbi:MAG: CotH kinase family protein, partial [Clostridia bacterium]|nr:CotH kinase family protein [Clostridia bacterium]